MYEPGDSSTAVLLDNTLYSFPAFSNCVLLFPRTLFSSCTDLTPFLTKQHLAVQSGPLMSYEGF